MLKVDPAKERVYKKFKGGDARALIDLLESTREDLYDYLMRMTGQVSRSAETVDEVYQSLTDETLDTCASFTDLKVCLFSTARKFNADIWNAQTAKLINASLEAPADPDQANARLVKDRAAFKALDKSLRHLAGAEREAVILRTRADFDFEEIAQIVGLSAEVVEQTFDRGMQIIDAECSGIVQGPEATLARLPHHPLPPMSSQATINLSVVMQDIKTRPVGLNSPVRIALTLMILAFVGAWIFYPELVDEHVFAPVKSLLERP